MRYWNYGRTEDEFDGRETWKTRCGMVTCTKAGGVFQKGDVFPFYYRYGYPNIVIINIDKHDSQILRMDCYEDCLRIVGCNPEWEDAEFREGVI